MGPRGPKKHLKRLAAPKSWMLTKLGGVFTCKPSSGPHKMRESMPIALFLRYRLNYALTMKEVTSIMKQRLVKIDGKGRICVHRITGEEAKYKLCRVLRVSVGPNN